MRDLPGAGVKVRAVAASSGGAKATEPHPEPSRARATMGSASRMGASRFEWTAVRPIQLVKRYHPRIKGGSSDPSDKRHQIRGEPLRLLPVRSMAGAVVHHEPGARHSGNDCFLRASPEHRVSIAPGHEGRRLELAQLVRVIHLREVSPDRSPDPGRKLPALLYHLIQKGLGDRLRQRALLELANEPGINRIGEIENGCLELCPRRKPAHRGA